MRYIAHEYGESRSDKQSSIHLQNDRLASSLLHFPKTVLYDSLLSLSRIYGHVIPCHNFCCYELLLIVSTVQAQIPQTMQWLILSSFILSWLISLTYRSNSCSKLSSDKAKIFDKPPDATNNVCHTTHLFNVNQNEYFAFPVSFLPSDNVVTHIIAPTDMRWLTRYILDNKTLSISNSHLHHNASSTLTSLPRQISAAIFKSVL